MSGCRTAIVIPVLDDATALRALLERIRDWSAQPSEIHVVAAARSPAIATVCRELDCELSDAQPCRGRQLDVGAHATTAELIWFLHADSEPHDASLAAIAAARARGAESGCFRFAFAGPPIWQKGLVSRGVALRLRLGGIPYGDQGLWMTRTSYDASGGFAHEPLFEEVTLVKQLRKRGTFIVLETPIGVSARRWERDGWWRRCAANRLLALGHALGVSPTRLAARYYSPRVLENRP